jgi:hypothetical protein
MPQLDSRLEQAVKVVERVEQHTAETEILVRQMRRVGARRT